jgi:hypothetical protein
MPETTKSEFRDADFGEGATGVLVCNPGADVSEASVLKALDRRLVCYWCPGRGAAHLRCTAEPGNAKQTEESYSSFFGSFDMRSRRSCMSFIWRRRLSMLSSSTAGSGTFSGSTAATPPRGGTNGLNIEKVC